VRGLNSGVRQDSVRDLVESSKVDMVCLRETKNAKKKLGESFSLCLGLSLLILSSFHWSKWWHLSGLETFVGVHRIKQD
jgi:hypothetical protein